MRRLLAVFQHVQHLVGDMQGTLRLWGFYVVHDLTNDATLNAQSAVQPIDILPLQGKCFADSQTETYAE